MISFSGIDGAGKSTQIDGLRSLLEDAGLKVRILTFWDDIARLKRFRESAGRKIFKGDEGVGSPHAPIERRDKNIRSPLATLLRLGFYYLDARSLRSVLAYALRSDSDVIICDRYLWDELANLDLNHAMLRWYARTLAARVPRPEISFILDADPVQARTRKPEYPLAWLHVNRTAYLTLSELLGGMTVIPPLPLPEAQEYVQQRATALLHTRATTPS